MSKSVDKIQAKLNGDECDAFSRRSRHLITWRRGELKRIKRTFGKKVRQLAKQRLRQEPD